MARRKMKQVALKLSTKNMKLRSQGKRRKAEILRKIINDQECIRKEQRKIRGMFAEIRGQCHQQKKENEKIMKRTARAQVKVVIMFRIFKAREGGNFTEAARLTKFLREFVANENAIVNLAEMTNEHQSPKSKNNKQAEDD